MMITMDAYDAYKKFLAIGLHFRNDNYDYFTYHGSVKTSKSKFDCRNDKYFYHKLAKIESLEIFLASAFMRDDKIWVGNLFDEKYEKQFQETQKRLQSLEYNFKKDLSRYDSLDEALNVFGDDYPDILMQYKRGAVAPETLIILNDCLKVFKYWDDSIQDKVVWPNIRRSLSKYAPFVKYEKTKYKGLLVDLYQ